MIWDTQSFTVYPGHMQEKTMNDQDGELDKMKKKFKRMSSGRVTYNPKPTVKRWNGVALVIGIGPGDFSDCDF